MSIYVPCPILAIFQGNQMVRKENVNLLKNQEKWWKSQFFYIGEIIDLSYNHKQMIKLLGKVEKNLTEWFKYLDPLVSLDTKVEQAGIIFSPVWGVIGSAQHYLWSIAYIGTSRIFCTLKNACVPQKAVCVWLYQLIIVIKTEF